MRNFIYLNYAEEYLVVLLKKIELIVDNVWFCACPGNSNSVIEKAINRIITNRRFDFPFQRYWIKRYLDKRTKKMRAHSEDICFVIQSGIVGRLGYRSILLLKKMYPKSKFVYDFTNPVEYYQKVERHFDLGWLKHNFSLITTYNRLDAAEYDLMESRPVILPFQKGSGNTTCDVFFIGADKGRLDKILEVYDICEKRGFICDFSIVGVEPEKRKQRAHINYLDAYVDYNEVLERVKRSKCILNIIQDNSSGITMREIESIGMNKFLITNNPAIFNSPLYTPEKVLDYSKLSSEVEKLTHEPDEVEWKNAEEYSVKNYYSWLEHLVWPNE